MGHAGRRLGLGVLVAAACILPACDPGGAGAPELLPVALPDLDRAHASVRAQAEAAQAALDAAGRGSAERGAAYGRLGVLLMAAEYLDAAEPSLRNAVRLLPQEFRWTYYLAHLYRQQGDLAQAAEYFERAHDLRSDDFATLIWLVGARLNLGQPEAAEPWLARARALRPGSAVVRFQEGRTAAATRDHARAVEHLNAVLRLDPNAAVVHYPLAMAYRALGDLEAAEYHLGRAVPDDDGGGSLGLSDPLLAELATLLRTPQAHRARALEADANGDWPEAVRQFEMAVELDPADPLMRLSLAMAHDRAGEPRAALPELEAALRLDPGLTQAHYVLGTLLERGGRDAEAIDRFTTAVAQNPGSAEAQLRLANALRRTGRVEASLAPYRQALEIDAGAEEARLGEALALVRLGRHREARARLEAALGRTAGHPLFATALARLLAASPDSGVRDGRRAFELAEAVVAEHQTTDVAETMAMALAELGEFRGAMEWQQLAVDVATDAGRPDLAARMSDNLARYRRGEPCRTPWRDDAPEHRPGPMVEPGLLGAAP